MLINAANIFGSRVFGLVRDILAAAFWGSTEVMQAAFTTAFTIPNTFRSLFAEGAFSAAFVPLIAKKLEAGEESEAWRLACRTITIQTILLAVICVVVSVISGGVLYFLPETSSDATTQLIFKILPLLIPYALFICVAGAFAAILNALRHFAIPAATPILFNVVQIITLVLLFVCGKTRHEFSSLVWFCISVLVAGVLQMFVLMYFCARKGFHFHFDFTWNHPDVKVLCKKILPGLAGAGVHQINILIDRTIAVFVGATAVGAINYSNRIVFLPIGIFGVAMNTICLTNMARAKDDREMADCLDAALRQVLFLALPCTAFLAALNSEVIRLLFQRGAFTTDSVRECALALIFYLPGLPAFCAAKVAVTTHHGRSDTLTPVIVSVICVFVNFILNILLIHSLRQGGLALASSLSSWLNVLILLAIDTRKLSTWNYWSTIVSALRLAVAAALAGIAAYGTNILVTNHIPSTLGATLSALIVIMTSGFAGLIVYGVVCPFLARTELNEFLGAFRRKRKK
ncbi:MAG: murein biosynthesis integral membrane protein MurJ [Victivallales bacterium]|nr:murein biosynthesis integral membrane protein MurJ [Victivallales bacterium]